MAAMILISVPLGIYRSFARLREDAMDSYYYDRTGYAVYQGIENRREAAKNLLTVAQRYADGNSSLDPYIDELEYREKYMSQLYDFQGFSQEVEANLQLGEAFQALCGEMERVELSERDKNYLENFTALMESEQDKLERSSYNDGAIEYNQKLDSFLTSLLGGLVGVKPMGVFGSGSGTREENP